MPKLSRRHQKLVHKDFQEKKKNKSKANIISLSSSEQDKEKVQSAGKKGILGKRQAQYIKRGTSGKLKGNPGKLGIFEK